MATNLNRTVSTSTSNNKFTISVWIKRSELSSGSYRAILTSRLSGSSSSVGLWFKNDSIAFLNETSSSGYNENVTTEVFRDVNAWYHIVIAGDTTQSGTDKLIFYVNGEQITSFSTDNRSSFVGLQYSFGHSGYDNYIGSKYDGSYQFYGIMSHYHFIDGTAYDASAFGSTDATTGEWKLNTAPNVTYGNNGFFILKDGNSITDQSGEGNNWTVANGTLTKTEDCPSNVFCTLNRLNSDQPTGSVNIQYGNTGFEDGENGSNYSYVSGTLAANSGKFYWETKVTDLAEIDQVGVALASSSFTGIGLGGGLQNNFGGKSVQFSNGNKAGDSAQSAHMGGFSEDDIMMVALDLDNNKITFGRNGQWSNGSGGADQTYANSTAAFTNLTAGEYYMPAHAMRGYGGNTGISRYNFGNGYFATTAVSSAGTNASNIGIFEYDVPSGFTALSTKGLNL